jgi:hypothetical protein
VDVSPSGGGTVEIDGIAPDEYPYGFPRESDSTIKIEAVPEEGYHFVEWDTIGKQNPKRVIVKRDMSITALFVPDVTRFTSLDETVHVIIPDGVIALDGEGNPLTDVEFVAAESVPDPPENASIIGLPYQLGPDGATFDPPVTLTWSYKPADIPDGVAEEELVIAHYDEGADEWQELEFEVDPGSHTLTAYIDHFSTFAVIAFSASPPPPVTPAASAAFTLSSLSISPPEVSAGEAVTISVFLVNAGEAAGSYTATLKINGVAAETREVSLVGGTSETVTFTTSQGEAGAYSIEVNGLPGSFTVKEGASPPIAAAPAPPGERNWWLTRGVIITIAAAIAIPLAIRWWRRRGDCGSLGDYISMR